jgi:predicted phage baseplate assembly protein
MPLVAPNLDDRRFDDLLAEIRARIPRYTPEWTDHNDSDPGIILGKLFAWMTELTLYRVNQIPERAYIKFLEMAGVAPKAAGPARTDLVFSMSRTDIADTIVPTGTQVAAAADADGPILFETTRSATLLGTALTAVQVFDGTGYSTVTTAAAAAGQWFQPFGPLAREGAALLLGFATGAPFTGNSFDLLVRLPATDRPPAPLAAGTVKIPANAVLVWEYRDAGGWQPVDLLSDGTRTFTQDGYITVVGPGAQVVPMIVGGIATPLYWLRCRLVTSYYEQPPRLDAILPNAIPAVQSTTAVSELLGRSDGSPDQVFTLAHTPVVTLDKPVTVIGSDNGAVTVTSLWLEVDEGLGALPWQQVEDFLASGPDDPHYTLDQGSGVITFGDDIHGRIPIATPAGSIVARSYQWGGGLRGNLPAGTIATLQSFVAGVGGVTNPYPSSGGADEETVAATKRRAAGEIASNGRAVTAADFEIRALATPGARIARALAVPLMHPNYPGAPVPGVVTVIVVPDAPGPSPLPNAATLAAVTDYLDEVRLLTAELYASAPRYRTVRVQVSVRVTPDADPAAAKLLLEQRLDTFFHPLTGGLDPVTGTPGAGGWPWGGTIFVSDLFRVVLETPGIAQIADGQMVVTVDGIPGQFCRDTALCPGDLTCSNGHDVSVVR